MSKDSETVAITIRLDKAMHRRGRIVIAELSTTFKGFFESCVARAEREIAADKAAQEAPK